MRANNSPKNITWDQVLFFALYIIMPEYLAVELSGSLPLITASRAVLVLLGIMMLIRKRSELLNLRGFSLKNWQLLLTGDPLLRWGMLGYFILLIITNMSFLFSMPSVAIKELFVVVAEQYALVWLLTMTVDTREKLEQCLKVLVYASGITAVVAVVGVAFDVNPFHLLKTTQRDMLMTTYYRLGMLRAEAGFGHPVFYGAFCAVIIPICMHFLEESKKKWERILFSGCTVMNLLALFFSNSRGSLIAFVALMVLVLPIKLFMKLGKKNILNYIAIAVATAVLLLVVTEVSPAGTGFLRSLTNSVMQVFVPEQTEPPVTEPPATQLPVTEPPATQPPVAEPPATQSPVTEPPATQPPVTEPPATQPPVTEPPATQPPVTEPPTTEPPATEPVVDYGENSDGLRSRLVQLTGIEWTLKHKPIFGFGSGAQNRRELKYEFEPDKWWSSGSVDVGIVAVIGQFGLVGLLGYCMLYGSVLITLLCKKMWEDKLMLMFFFCFAGICLCLLSISSMDRTMWVLIGLFVCLVNLKHKKQQ